MSKLGRVLIVEDDMELVFLLKTILEDEGFETDHALGEEALKLAEQTQPDLILLDVMMPQMDGLEWSNRAKANLRVQNIPIIVLSAAGAHLLKGEYKYLQATSYVPKPFDIDQLLNLVYAFRKVQMKIKIPDFSFN